MRRRDAPRRSWSLWSALMLGLSVPCRADFSGSSAGTGAAQFLSLGDGARGAAMGEAFTAVADDATSVRYNPAAMVRVPGNSVAFMHLAGLQSTSLEHAAYVRRFSPLNAAGFSLLYMNYGSIARTDETGASLGAASPSDLALTLAYARRLAGFGTFWDGGSAGLSATYIRSKIVDTASGVTGTLGFLSRPFGSLRTRFSFVGENLGGGGLKFDQNSDPLPTAFKLGGSIAPLAGLLASAELGLPEYGAPYAAAGIERRFEAFKDGGLALRAGLNTATLGSLGTLSGFSFGIGFTFASWAFDYAFVPFGDLGTTNRVSLSLRFGEPVEREDAASELPPSRLAPIAEAEPPAPRPAPGISAVPAARPETVVPPADPFQDHMNAARQYDASSDYAAAAGEYRRAIEADVTRSEAHLGLGRALMALSDWKGAASEWSAAERLIPKDDARRVYLEERLGAVGVRRKDLNQAKTHYLNAVELAKAGGIQDQSVVNAYLGLAFTLGELGQRDAAVKNYQKVKMLTESAEMRDQIDARIRQLRGGDR